MLAACADWGNFNVFGAMTVFFFCVTVFTSIAHAAYGYAVAQQIMPLFRLIGRFVGDIFSDIFISKYSHFFSRVFLHGVHDVKHHLQLTTQHYC
jgi:hypothetical protein